MSRKTWEGSAALARTLPGGSLYQPVYLGVRDDIPASACSLGPFKAETEEG